MMRKKRGMGQSTPATSGKGKILGTTSRGRSPAPTGRGEIHASTSRGRSRTATKRVKSLSPSPSPSPSPPTVSDIKSPAASSEKISPSPTAPPAVVNEQRTPTPPAPPAVSVSLFSCNQQGERSRQSQYHQSSSLPGFFVLMAKK